MRTLRGLTSTLRGLMRTLRGLTSTLRGLMRTLRGLTPYVALPPTLRAPYVAL